MNKPPKAFTDLLNLWNESLEKLIDYNSFIDYLTFSARFYKYSFSDTLLIRAQNPNATLVADLSSWNRIAERWIIQGSKSIALFSPNQYKCRYVFDISQTKGTKTPKTWTMNDEVFKELSLRINSIYEKENIIDSIKNIAYDIVNEKAENENLFDDIADLHKVSDEDREILKPIFYEYISQIATYVIANRINYNTEKQFINYNPDFSELHNAFVNSLDTARVIGQFSATCSSATIKEIENHIKIILNERKNTYEQHIDIHNRQERLSEPEHISTENTTTKLLRNRVDEMDGTEPTDNVSRDDDEYRTNPNSIQSRSSGNGISPNAEGELSENKSDDGYNRHSEDGSVQQENGTLYQEPGTERHSLQGPQTRRLPVTEDSQELYKSFFEISPEILTGELDNIEITSGRYNPLTITRNENIITLVHTTNGELDPKIEMITDDENKSLSVISFIQEPIALNSNDNDIDLDENFEKVVTELLKQIKEWQFTTETTETKNHSELTVNKTVKHFNIVVSPVDSLAYQTQIKQDNYIEEIENLIGKDTKIEYSDNDNFAVIYSTQSELNNNSSKVKLKINDVELKGLFCIIGYNANTEKYKSLSKAQISDFTSSLNSKSSVFIQPNESPKDYEEAQLSIFDIPEEPQTTTTVTPGFKINETVVIDNTERIVSNIDLTTGTVELQQNIENYFPIFQKLPISKVNEQLKESESKVTFDVVKTDYVYSEDDIVTGGAKERFKANINAINLLKEIEKEKRLATTDEQHTLAKYSGWGGSAEAFNSNNDSWKDEYSELKTILTEEEYTAARASTLTAYYTPYEITKAINDKIVDLGFKGGNVLDPSFGTGAFYSAFPEELKEKTHFYATEIDPLTSRIAKQLHQNVNLQNCGYENSTFNNSSFDVVMSNVPFSDIGVIDREYDRYNFKIHDYFFAKSADKLKPGGVMAFITAPGTLDKKNSTLRKYLAERCELVGAIRLPEGTFPGTKASADIIFLQRRQTFATELPDWIFTSLTDNGYRVNNYFIQHPEMICGTLKENTRYGNSEDYSVIANGNTLEQLKICLNFIQSEHPISQPDTAIIVENHNDFVEPVDEVKTIPADPNVRNFTHTIVDGKLYYRENGEMRIVTDTGKRLERILGLHSIRLTVREIINAQVNNCSDEELTRLQNELNSKYDKYIKKYGEISTSQNSQAFSHDDDYNLLVSLEIYDNKTEKYLKTDIFSKRTIKAKEPVSVVSSAPEALFISLDTKAKVDIPYMAELYKTTPEQLISELKGYIYRNPSATIEGDEYSGYEESGEYLSGNVRLKLKIAKEYAKDDEQYSENVKALENVQPDLIEAGDISVRLGVSWIDIEDYEKFMYDLFQTPRYRQRTKFDNNNEIIITRIPVSGEWKIRNTTLHGGQLIFSTYGSERIGAYQILENLLNQRDIVVKDRVDSGDKVTYVINDKQTQIAISRANKIKEEFNKWIWNDIDRRNKYVERYNDLFNCLRGRDYSNIKLSYPDMSPLIELNPHQNAAVARAVFSGNTLLAHCVGAGKTFEMAAATMERKRLGLITKACVVVPKHIILQTAHEWQTLYPNIKMLVATPKDFEKNNRRRFISRCVTGDYDAVLMSFEQFEKIKMSYDFRVRFIKKQIAEVTDSISNSEDKASVKQLESIRKNMEKRLDKLLKEDNKDSMLEFEQLGFDSIVVDEAHYYKNCYVKTKMSNVSGVAVTAAQKSEDMLMKCQYLNKKTNYRGVIFATGTPVTNTMVELYVMTRYLRPDILEASGNTFFDDWAASFGEVVKQLEVKPEGSGYRMKSRFAKFVNLPELLAQYREFADIVTADMIDLPIPKIKGDKPTIVVAKPSPFQREIMKTLAERSEKIHNGSVDPSVDNMLVITNDARRLGLDGRAYDDSAENFPESKVNICINNCLDIYKATADTKGVQIIWSDIAVNSDVKHSFSVYQYIKETLIDNGIPEKEIAIIGDYNTDRKRDMLFAQAREGSVRFIIASTSKLGTGANIQVRLAATHHLDIPWRPSDFEQRNGRILRQGNMYDEVEIFNYTTENTFDLYMLNTVTTKQKFISQMSSQCPARTMEDVDEMVLTYSEMQALTAGNPMIKEKIELDNEIHRLSILESDYQNNKYRLQDKITKRYPERISQMRILLEKSEKDIEIFNQYATNNEEFEIEIDGKKYNKRKEAGEAILKHMYECKLTGNESTVGHYRGFRIAVDCVKNFYSDTISLQISIVGKLRYSTDIEDDNTLGNILRLENMYKSCFNQKYTSIKQELEHQESNLANAIKELETPFNEAEKLKELRERLEFVNAELSKDSGQPNYINESETEAEVEIEAEPI